jgi:hypothetical protein
MLKTDASIMRQSRAEVDDYLDYLGVSAADQLAGLEQEFVEGLKLKIVPAQRVLFMSLFEPQGVLLYLTDYGLHLFVCSGYSDCSCFDRTYYYWCR